MARSLERVHPVADWMTHERRNWIAGIIVAALGAYSVGNGHTTTGAIQHVSWQLGEKKAQIVKLKVAAHCEDARATKASSVAGQAILSANIDAIQTPKFGDIPVDNCPHPKP